jgi:hypothetical protein
MQEHCSLCDSPTGRAGRGEDSIYIETNDGEVGPLCEVCHKSINEAIEACCKALAEGQKPSHNSAILEIALCVHQLACAVSSGDWQSAPEDVRERINAVIAQLQK